MAETVLAKMAVEIAANTAGFTKALQSTESKLSSFTNNLGNIARTVGIAFGVQQVASFAFEVAKLSGEAEGVRAAFEKFPDSVALLERLKDATAGTVSELELMRRTVQATNFGISLESLPKLLEFAAVRAQQTGQSVDYLVDSIVTGIGRKSPLILDNLGISAVALREKMNGVALATADIGDVSAAVGQIAEEELKKMGGFSETAAVKVARLTASWENFKVTLGNIVTAGGLLEGVLDDLSGVLSSLTNADNANFIQFQKNLAESIKNDSEPTIRTMMKELNLLRNELKTPISESFAKQLVNDFKLNEEQSARFLKIVKEINGEIKKIEPVKTVDPVEITTLESLQEKVKRLNQEFADLDVTNKAALVTKGQEIVGINEQIKALEELRKARKASEIATPDTVNAYQAALQELNKELEDVNVNDTERIRILSAQIAGYQDAINNVERLKRSFQDFDAEITIPVPDLSGLLNPLREIQTTAGAITFTSISDNLTEVTKRVEEQMGKLVKVNKDGLDKLVNDTINLGPLVSNGIAGIADALGTAAVGAGNFGKDIIKVVAGFAKQFGEILIATGVGALALKKALFSNPIVAIVAGAALVALASAAGAAASKAHSSAFGGGSSGGGRTTSNVTNLSAVQQTPEQRITFDAKFEIEGNKLVAVANNTTTKKQRTG